MAVVNNLTIDGQLFGITSTKGDIIVNDGISNVALPTLTDGYILSADSTQPQGLRWIPNSGGGGVATNEIYLAPFHFSTTNTNPTIMPNTEYSGISGNILFIGTINCVLSRARRYFTIGLYKNGVLIPNTQKTYGGIDNVIIPVPIHQTIVLMGSDTFDIRINVNNSDTMVTIEGINPFNTSSIINSDTIIAFNTTDQFEIQDLTFSGANGTVALIANINCVLNRARSYFMIGIYKNGSLVENSEKKYGGIDDLVIPVQINQILQLVSTDIIQIRINLLNANTTIIVKERTLIYTVYSNSISMVPQLNSSTIFATNDILPNAISDLTLTGISGNFLIMGELNGYVSRARCNFYVGLYLNGSLITYTNKEYGGVDGVILSIPYITIITLQNTDIFEVKVWVESNNCVLTIIERSLLYVNT